MTLCATRQASAAPIASPTGSITVSGEARRHPPQRLCRADGGRRQAEQRRLDDRAVVAVRMDE
jgi:hypothetical protein